DGERLNAGEQGEICLKGPHLCLGYIDSELDKTAFDSEGYLRSGDLGVLDSDGWLTVTGRLKDVIIRKGENISAKKVEDAIASHPVVAEVTVVGVPDDERGELACAVIVLRAGCEGFGLGELANYCLQQGLLKQECPERIEFVDEIPRNASGKVVKQRLLSLLTA
ncbi:MAG: cyclohexanecarboxylate-CoA ligase, partial [Pseudomonadota bacterium]|nr:cyclohexanecarboxylate-CoA ligase [Pseudomonadota bacterium]